MAALLLLFGFAGYSTHGDFDKMMKLLDKVLAPLTTLIGVAMTFYFKNSSR